MAYHNLMILKSYSPTLNEYYPATGDRGDNSIDIGGWRHCMMTLRFRGDEIPCWTNIGTIYFYQEFGKCNIYQTICGPSQGQSSCSPAVV